MNFKTQRILLTFTAILLLVTESTLAQKEVELVAPGIISTDKDYCTTLSPDGKTLYFVRKNEKGIDEILMSKWKQDTWDQPQSVSFSGIFSDTDPLLSPDGLKMYFMTNRKADQSGWKSDYDLWVVDWEDDQWGQPYPLPDFINTSFTEGFPSTASNGNLYFFRANKPGHSEQDIWFSPKIGGGFDVPKKLGNKINTQEWDGHPFISPDEEYLIFYSYRKGGAGKCDLYISFRENDEWGNPKNLGPGINTSACEMVPFVSRDHKTLYFTRIISGTRNIYQVDFEPILRDLKPN